MAPISQAFDALGSLHSVMIFSISPLSAVPILTSEE
jgi:hypothetical protein